MLIHAINPWIFSTYKIFRINSSFRLSVESSIKFKKINNVVNIILRLSQDNNYCTLFSIKQLQNPDIFSLFYHSHHSKKIFFYNKQKKMILFWFFFFLFFNFFLSFCHYFSFCHSSISFFSLVMITAVLLLLYCNM